ncbi:unnamed protein product [Symbiodinium pilosum]|uniref:Sodium/calcium exchanger membrane region domain-containing protein n=1 Tax=Symbiodinium pilosum TaxID=2952 RepID=A0A812YHC4_SYMPI|nr:unnamed protein product [Symbiodinium pilosum]
MGARAACAASSDEGSLRTWWYVAMRDLAFQLLALAELAYLLADTSRQHQWQVHLLIPLTYSSYVVCIACEPRIRRWLCLPSMPPLTSLEQAETSKVAEEGHARPMQSSRPAQMARPGEAAVREAVQLAHFRMDAALGEFEEISMGSKPDKPEDEACRRHSRCEDTWSHGKDCTTSTGQRLALSIVAGIICLSLVTYVLLDCLARLACVSGVTPSIMGFVVVAAGLRIPGMLDVASGKCPKDDAPNLPAGLCMLLTASYLGKVRAPMSDFQFLTICGVAQMLSLLAVLKRKRRCVGYLLLAAYLLCIVLTLALFYIQKL